MAGRAAVFLRKVLRWVRYLYFLRFSIALWLIPLVLIGLNMTGATTLTSGIVVPDYGQQYLCVAFFLVSAAFGALISARVVVINGPERWNEGLPPLLKLLLVNETGKYEWVALLGSQIPNLFLFGYLYSNGVDEGVKGMEIWSGLAIGAVLAVFLWWVANAWYYLTYELPPLAGLPLGVVKLGKNAARTILFPRWCFGLAKPGDALTMSTLEGATTCLKRGRLASILNWPTRLFDALLGLRGYLYPTGQLYEAHSFATNALAVFLGLYLTIWPLAAPVPAVWMSTVMLVLLTLVVAAILYVFWSATPGVPGTGLFKWKVLLTLSVGGFWLAVILLYLFTSADRFPTLATLLVMVIVACWALAGIAFFADRYRVPVLTTIIVLMLLPRILGGLGNKEEHYFSTTSVPRANAKPVPTPAEILDERLPDMATREDEKQDKPLIIVTATGGGLHASAWTATVLAELEKEFTEDQEIGEAFHNHLLLVSTVSGGSVGLLSYLRELHEGTLGLEGNPGRQRMQSTAQCSSLEAVGWGLMYYDLQKAFVPLLPYLISPSPGDSDLDTSPLLKDRTWALRKGIARNQNDAYCSNTWDRDTHPGASWSFKDLFHVEGLLKANLDARKQNEKLESELTLRNLSPAVDRGLPAFTMNTTTVEKGERFLLANYRVPHYELDEKAGYPAESFLEIFGQCNSSAPDLPLATAAQLSATFPYVSSSTRAPQSVDARSVHFVDGGYYDNDGTTSAIEFLRYALAPSQGLEGKEKADQLAAEKILLQRIDQKLARHPLRILLIEIRNSPDPAEDKAQEISGGHGAEKSGWNLFGQTTAVPQAFWNAGHESVTGRNRAALGLLERALYGKVQIHRVVIADENAVEDVGTDPLSWSLTPKQRAEVRHSACHCVLAEHYDEALKWFKMPREQWIGDGQEYLPSLPSPTPLAAHLATAK